MCLWFVWVCAHACVYVYVCVLSFICVEEQEWVRQSKLFIQVQRSTTHYKDK